MRALLQDACERGANYLEGLPERNVYPTPQALERLRELRIPLPDGPTSAEEVLRQLDEIGSPATVASAGGRYFGFVIGGALPVTVAANWLAGAWDQNAGLFVTSPASAVLEEVALSWLVDVFSLPAGTGGGLVTGATAANFCGLIAARHAVLRRHGWDVEAQGLFGAPEIKVVVGDEVHFSVLKALTMLGLGRERVIRVPVDGQGRMRADALPALDDRTIVCIQAGNVNTGAFDPAGLICRAAREAGAWVHVDGAFGLWAQVSPSLKHLTAGIEMADSWATDGHKWLNVPYDCGLVFCREAANLPTALGMTAAYLMQDERRDPFVFTPEASRRARGVEVWAALLSLGRDGLAEMIERSCRHAARLAEGLQAAGCQVLNEVSLNQVLVAFGDAEATQRAMAAIQAEGTCWCSGTVWQGHTAMRISICGWATTDEDIKRSLAAMLRAADEAV